MRKISICIITLGRKTLYKTLESIIYQEFDYKYEIILVLQGEINKDKLKEINYKNIDIKIYNYKKGLGFGYYRNQAIKKSKGDILVWIDDDEYTKNKYWLKNITEKIIIGEYKVITAGTDIELGKGYLADSISYLGYPGGGAVGFDKMWTVNKNNITNHLCSGNFAFDKDTLKIVDKFNEELKNGAEDVAFGTRLSNNGVKIYYEKKATIYHVYRNGIINFAKWHLKRGKSIYEFKKLGLISGGHWKDKFKSVKFILFENFFTKYVFGIWFMFFLQNLFNLIGFLNAKFKNNINKSI